MARLTCWQPKDWQGDRGFRKKEYKSYDEYVEHQKDGMKHKGEKVIFGRFKTDLKRFTKNFRELPVDPCKTLCLGARSGAEVQAFRDLGFDAIGVDLEPGTKNDLVEKGDFHNLRFADDSFDLVYTNAFDHVFDLEKALNEVKRVLKEDGHFALEMVSGYSEGGWPGDHESAYWGKAQDFVDTVCDLGFQQFTPIQNVPHCKGLPFKRIILCLKSSSATTNENP